MIDGSDLFERLKAPLSDHYELERELGAGGMAIVFLARDVKHDREVALKVFRPELASSLGSERFLREIKIAAKLSHPHILPLYDSGEVDGFLYYTMPLVEGESLADRIEREQMLPLDDALQITREVADALNYAHARGLVHRDIKPDNLMLTGGHAVVTDFGIARAVSAAGGDRLTQTGMAVGTPLYMSPEQAVAVEEIDGRSDIYALGCVLYEMVAGTPPFTGPTPQAVMARHSIDHVPSPAIIRDTISPELEDVIMCALAKAPADRFRTAGDFAEALKVIHTGTGTMPRMSVSVARPSRVTRTTLTTPLPFSPRRMTTGRSLAVGSVAALVIGLAVYQFGFRNSGSPVATGPAASSIAVLYFEDLSGDGEFGFVADGVTEGLIRQLSRVQGLDVISRNGVAPYRGTDVTPDSIGRALEVGSVIRGTVEPEGDDLRVSAQLLEGSSGASIKRASFVLPATDLLAVMDSAAQSVSRLLREWIGEEVRVRGQRMATTSDDAWALVARAERTRKNAERHLAGHDIPAAYQAFLVSDSLLNGAEGADPAWIEPAVLRGRIAYQLARLEFSSPREAAGWVDTGMDHAARALGIDPNYPEAIELRGTLRLLLWYLRVTPDREEAEALFNNAREDLENAVEADPTLARAHNTLSNVYANIGDAASEVLAARRAYEEDAYLTFAPEILWRLYSGYYDLQQPMQAQGWCDEGGRRFPTDHRFVQCQLWLMTTNAAQPDVDAARQLLDVVDSLAPNYWKHEARMLVGGITGLAGDRTTGRLQPFRSGQLPGVETRRWAVPARAGS